MTMNFAPRLRKPRTVALALSCVAVLGVLASAPAAFAAGFCRDTGNVYFAPNPVAQGGTIFLTGITCPHTSARFLFYDANNTLVWDQTTHPSRGNCVIHHDDEFRTVWLAPGDYRVQAQFLDDFCQFTDRPIGTLHVTRPPCRLRCDEGWLDGENCVCNCNEGAEESCYSSGGIWDARTCHCNNYDPCPRGRICPERAPVPEGDVSKQQ